MSANTAVPRNELHEVIDLDIDTSYTRTDSADEIDVYRYF